jgi:hypothetical protein
MKKILVVLLGIAVSLAFIAPEAQSKSKNPCHNLAQTRCVKNAKCRWAKKGQKAKSKKTGKIFVVKRDHCRLKAKNK